MIDLPIKKGAFPLLCGCLPEVIIIGFTTIVPGPNSNRKKASDLRCRPVRSSNRYGAFGLAPGFSGRMCPVAILITLPILDTLQKN